MFIKKQAFIMVNYTTSIYSKIKVTFFSFLLIFSFTILGNLGFAQKGNNWYFGKYAGITFNTTPPSVLLNSSMFAREGCATMSDKNGQLLFYTDGRFVYNRNHQLMPNGSDLMGHPSSTNAAIIIPLPGSDSLFYIFTVDAAENIYANGYRYSIVNMNLNAGLGDVSVKNILLYAKSSEKITAVKHANGIDTWIVTKDYLSNTYRVFKLSCNGIDINPVISHTGIEYGTNNIRVGSIKVSPNGNKIATVQYMDGWEIFDFNKTTGQLYNPLFINLPNKYLFGVEFSPDSKLIYLSGETRYVDSNTTTSGGTIYQYKIDVHDSTTIVNSRYIITSGHAHGDIQLGPDDKIYAPDVFDSSLSVINNPNQYGASCNFMYKAINLGGRIARRCLPTFFKDNINSSLIDISYSPSFDCSLITFTASTSLPAPAIFNWDFGDGNTATGQTVSHSYATNGAYIVKLSVNNSMICGANGLQTKILNLTSQVSIPKFDYTIPCGSKIVRFSDSSTNNSSIESWLWDFGDGQSSSIKNPVHIYNNYGQYLVKLKVKPLGVCSKEYTIDKLINIDSIRLSGISLGRDTVICSGLPFVLKAGAGFKNYRWQNGSIDSNLSIIQSGFYYVVANDYCGNQHSDSINVIIDKSAKIYLGSDTSICINKPLMLNAGNDFFSYLWNTGVTSQYYNINSAGSYSVTARNANGCQSSDTIKILKAYAVPLINLKKTPVLCINQNNRLSAGAGFSSYMWQDGSTDSTLIAMTTGLYKVIVGNSFNCYSSDSVQITKIASPPKNFLPKDSTICAYETIFLAPGSSYNQYLWSTGSVTQKITIKPPAKIWLKVIDENKCEGIDTINIFSKDCFNYVHIPNAFTPNNDGLNDVFKPIIRGDVENYIFSVFDRFGQQIFSTKKINEGWNGTIKGMPQNSGTFIWICSYKFRNAKSESKKGTIVLIR